MRLRLLLILSLSLLSGLAWAAPPRFVLVGHAPDTDPFWIVVRNSGALAAKDYQVDLDYRNPPNGDLADMARQLEQAAARNYAGIATSIADQGLIGRALRPALDKGIPVVTMNSGTAAQSKQVGGLLHVGQPEYAAGKAAGERAKAVGKHRFLCVNNFATNPISYERCRGFADAIGADYKSSTIDSGNDPVEIEAKVIAYLRQHPQTEAILTLGGSSAIPTIKAVRKLRLQGKVFFATFDLGPDIDAAIKQGTIAVAVDQQPFLQGYVPIALLAIMQRTHSRDAIAALNTLKADPRFQQHLREFGVKPIYDADGVDTGPALIDAAQLPLVERFAGRYR